MKLTIGLSYAPADKPKYQNYRNALTKAAETLEYEIELIDLSNNPGRAHGVLSTKGIRSSVFGNLQR